MSRTFAFQAHSLNLMFFDNIQKFVKTKSLVKKTEIAKDIYTKFIAKDSLHSLNLNEDIIREIHKRIFIFDDIKDWIFYKVEDKTKENFFDLYRRWYDNVNY